MKKTMIHFLALVLGCTFVLSVNAQQSKPGMREVFLYNRVTKEIKANCAEIMGRYDYKPRYECLDAKTNKRVPFELGADWKPVVISPVCMKNSVTGVVKNDCIKYESGQGGDVTYLYVTKDTGKPVVLDKQWEPLPLDDPLCEPVKFGEDDPIKHFEFEIISDLEQSAEEGDEQ